MINKLSVLSVSPAIRSSLILGLAMHKKAFYYRHGFIGWPIGEINQNDYANSGPMAVAEWPSRIEQTRSRTCLRRVSEHI